MTTQLPVDVLPEVAAFLRKSPGGRDWRRKCHGPKRGLVDHPRSGLGPTAGRSGRHAAGRRGSGGQGRAAGVRHLRLAALSPNERGVLLHRLADAVEKPQADHRPDRGPRRRQGPRPGRVGRAELRRYAPLLHEHGAHRHVSAGRKRGQSPNLRRNGPKGASHKGGLCPLFRPLLQPAGRRRPRGLDRAAAVGAVRVHLSLELPHLCCSAGTSRPPWPPATRW